MQTLTIEVEHFLIDAEYLGHLPDLGTNVFRKQSALVGKDPLERLDAFRVRARADHVRVVDAAHAERVEILEASAHQCHGDIPIARESS
ncbi:MAG TPA: hypothetical protein VGA56_25680 [Opitutaceae bacterium]